MRSAPNFTFFPAVPSRISVFVVFFLSLALSLSILSSISKIISPSLSSAPHSSSRQLKVFLADIPRFLNYGLLDQYWSPTTPPDVRIPSDPDHGPSAPNHHHNPIPPYPENPVIKQYSAEYWLTGDLLNSEDKRSNSFAKKVNNPHEADIIFVPFFAALSAEMELAKGRGTFRKKEGNDDYKRQKQMVDIILNSDPWKRSGGRDHVFVLTDPMAMWHVRGEICSAIFLVVDFGGWYKIDSKSIQNPSSSSSSSTIHHNQVSILKDVIVPYTHLLPKLSLSDDNKRPTLLYFKGAKHRQRGGHVREQMWDMLVNEPRVVMEEGFPNATGREQSIKGMRASEFCLHPAGDTPTSCRLFDAIQSLCIPVIVSDSVELPFEGVLDYTGFSVFVGVEDALKAGYLVGRLRSVTEDERAAYRRRMAEVQEMFEYENGYLGGIGPVMVNGAVNNIWKKISEKVPLIREAVARAKRMVNASVPLRCKCV